MFHIPTGEGRVPASLGQSSQADGGPGTKKNKLNQLFHTRARARAREKGHSGLGWRAGQASIGPGTKCTKQNAFPAGRLTPK